MNHTVGQRSRNTDSTCSALRKTVLREFIYDKLVIDDNNMLSSPNLGLMLSGEALVSHMHLNMKTVLQKQEL